MPQPQTIIPIVPVTPELAERAAGALSALFPEGVQPKDYATAARLVLGVSAPPVALNRPTVETPAPALPARKPQRAKTFKQTFAGTQAERLLAVFADGKLHTSDEAMSAAGIGRPQFHLVKKKIGIRLLDDKNKLYGLVSPEIVPPVSPPIAQAYPG